MNKGNILVTGGCGFIGSNFVRRLVREGWDGTISVLDKKTYAGRGENLKHMGLDIKTYVYGVEESVGQVFSECKPDVVVNFAAESHVDRSIESSTGFVVTNVLGTQNLLEISRKHGVSRFVQIGTDEVYGDLPMDSRPADEDFPIKCSSPYSASKASADLLALSYHRTHKMDVVVTRCSNNYGPYQYPEKLIPLMIVKAMAGEKLPVYGQGNQIRDWIHVEDHCRGILAALRMGAAGQVYNFGGDSELRNIEVVKTILDALGKSEEMIEYVEDRKGHDFRYAIDFSKAERELWWKPEVSWSRGIDDTIKWYQEKADWWRPLRGGK